MASKFATGADALEKAGKRPSFSRTKFFGIEDGETAIVRFLTDVDDWITVKQHGGVNTVPRPDWLDKERNWPTRMGVVCRETLCEGLPGTPKLWSVMDDASEMEGCIVDSMKTSDGKPYRASSRGWALGCLREEVREDGKIVGYRDKVREVETDDGTKVEKDVVIFNMGINNFFTALRGFAEHYGTALDRDYIIRRSGTGKDTDYMIIAADPVPGPDGERFDLRNPEHAARYEHGIDLDAEIERQASAQWLRRWFDPTFEPPKKKDDDDATSSDNGKEAPEAAQAKPANDVSDSDMEAMAARISGKYSPDEAAAEAKPEVKPEAAAASGGSKLRYVE